MRVLDESTQLLGFRAWPDGDHPRCDWVIDETSGRPVRRWREEADCADRTSARAWLSRWFRRDG